MLDWASLRAVVAIAVTSGWVWGISMYSILDRVANIPQSPQWWLAGGLFYGVGIILAVALVLLYQRHPAHQSEAIIRSDLESTETVMRDMLMRYGVRVEDTNGNASGVHLTGTGVWMSRQWNIVMQPCEEGTWTTFRASGGVLGSPKSDVARFMKSLAGEMPTGAVLTPMKDQDRPEH